VIGTDGQREDLLPLLRAKPDERAGERRRLVAQIKKNNANFSKPPLSLTLSPRFAAGRGKQVVDHHL
jgi:hypothetical protein